MSHSMTSERRTAFRYPVTLKAHVRSSESRSETQVENLSRTGLFLRGTADHGAPVAISLRLTESTLELSGRVVRDTDDGIGVHFDCLDRTTQHELANYVLARSYRAQTRVSRA